MLFGLLRLTVCALLVSAERDRGESLPLISANYPPAYASQPQGMNPYQPGYAWPPPGYGPPGYAPQALGAYPQQYLAPQPASYVPQPPSYPLLLYRVAGQNGVLQPGVPTPESIPAPGSYPIQMPPAPGFQPPPMLGQYLDWARYVQPPEAVQQNVSSMAPMHNPVTAQNALTQNTRDMQRPEPSALLDERHAAAELGEPAQRNGSGSPDGEDDGEEDWNADHDSQTSTEGLHGTESDAESWGKGVDPGHNLGLRQKLKPKRVFKRTYDDQLTKMVDTSGAVKSKTLETISDLIGVHEKLKEWKAANLEQAKVINSFHKDVNKVHELAIDEMKEKEGDSLKSFNAIDLNSFGTDKSTLKPGMTVDG